VVTLVTRDGDLCLLFSQVLSDLHVVEIGTGVLWLAQMTI